MKKVMYIITFLSVLSTMTFSQEAKKENLTNKQIYEILGKYMASHSPIKFDQLDMKEDEIASFMDGFKSGLKNKISLEELGKSQEDITSFLKQQMAEYQKNNPVTFPLDTKIATVDGKETTIKELLKDKKGVLLDFYASWCGPCMALMPKLKEKQIALKEKGIVVAGMNTENLEDAKKVQEDHTITFTWLVEPEGRPFSTLLGINSIPRMILINNAGVVVFNGHPEDESLLVKIESLK